ncbi:hypothetical protein Q31b_21000 [Novipirellula aureliae]|uniref:DUF1795 domain-containing protein n=1 Tax=Novipirellula aureliae TaxID=2527966 RepID=A0A5C6E052_9BACT|nr:hypothetical protein [Novipirellula aureliae]TWU43063.1 hypothetical protein Q31b_21000 [Novipirellula aureliae]
MPATFEHFGLRFLYPDNWVSVVDPEGGVTLQMPNGGFCSILREETTNSEAVILDQIAAAIGADYGEVEKELLPIDAFLDEGVAADLRFYYLDLMIVSRLIIAPLDGQRFVIQFQAECRDFDANEAVFSAIIKQLRETEPNQTRS